jgi:hypothetical protein
MKIVVIGGMSQLGSKVVSILKKNARRTTGTALGRTVDTVLDDCPPERADIAEDVINPSLGGQGCSGKDCARCSTCAAIGRLTIADLEIRHADEAAVHDANGDPEKRCYGVRLADLRLLPDYRAIGDAALFGGWPVPLPSSRKK